MLRLRKSLSEDSTISAPASTNCYRDEVPVRTPIALYEIPFLVLDPFKIWIALMSDIESPT